MKKKLFWLFVAFICIFSACLCTNYDYDFFDRIIVGERFIEQGILPYNDFISYTPTHPWYDHEWGSGVIFYALLKFFGPIGILFFYATMMFGIIFFVAKTQKLEKHHYPVTMIFTIIFAALFFRLNPTLIRCQLFSFFFFSVFLYVLEKHRTKGTKLIWLLPFITVFWNNVHGGVVSGLGLIFMYFIGELLNKKVSFKFIYILMASLPLLIINPYGVVYLKFLFFATTMARKYIAEWWPFYDSRLIMYYIQPTLFCVFGWILNVIKSIKQKHLDFTKFIIISVTLIEGIWHVKLLSLSLIAVSALCYNDIFRIFVKHKRYIKPIERSLYYVIITFTLTIPFYSPTLARTDINAFPLYEVEFLKLNNIKGNIAAPFGKSGYIAYKLYPDNLIYIDGRYEEVYSDKEFYTLRDFELGEKNWKDIINNYNTQILMPSKQTEAYKLLLDEPNWIHIYDGIMCGIFIKKDNVKQSYIEPEYNLDYYKRTMFKSTYFGKKIRGNHND